MKTILTLLFLLPKLVAASMLKTEIINRDEGDNVTLHCPSSKESSAQDLNWILENGSQTHNSIVQDDGSLYLINVDASDSQYYTCQDPETNQSLGSIKLNVRSVPGPVSNLTVITHSVYALVTWTLLENGGYPIQKFVLKYRMELVSNWTVIDDVQANTSSVAVFHLVPNSTYYFRMQAVNQLGPGPEISVMTKTNYDPEEVKQDQDLLSLEQSYSSNQNVYMK